ncbi:MAG: pyrroline-5-carboxylate reductase [Pseudomonadota bacterium]
MAKLADIVLVGCGNMGFAMLNGWLASGAIVPESVWVVEPSDELRLRAENTKVNTAPTAHGLPEELICRTLILAVKPQVMGSVLDDYQGLIDRANPTIVSVAAGIPIRRFETAFGDNRAVVRVMPNTPSAVGQGMMVMCCNAQVSETQAAFVELLLEASGKVAVIEDEDLMDAVTAVSGSGPAYLFHMVEALRDAGSAMGLPDDIAHTLAMQTIVGSANYASASIDDVAKLREQVTSPNGTTAAALSVLMNPEKGLRPLMKEAVKASRDRSKELGG